MQKPLSAIFFKNDNFFMKFVYLISLKWQLISNLHCNLSEITELKLIKKKWSF